ncbi:MAG: pilus assembly protein [Candidatus Thiodiazotropha sp. (ex Monitilora ramsayi)]|nr:pilus assembly protein [Candidatus Thiodiazotropha sp. (ex Monitilora ramsayi)]
MTFVKKIPVASCPSVGSQKRIPRQRGAVLIVALMLLLVMTILAVSGIGNSALEQRMSGNYHQSVSAFQAAEFGLRVAERWLNDNVNEANWENFFLNGVGPKGLYTARAFSAGPTATEVCRNEPDCYFDPNVVENWCSDGTCALPRGHLTLGVEIPTTLDLPVARQPQFIIEHVGPIRTSTSLVIGTPLPPPEKEGFRITVIAWGQDITSRHSLQSHVLLPL